MFREIISVWKGQHFMKRVVEEFREMLTDAEYVFTYAWKALTGEQAMETIKQPLYDKDIKVNKHEREIRRMVLEHLSINPQQDVSGCLIMMSLIKDAERIGDYAKNIFEAGLLLEGKAKDMKYMKRLSAIHNKLAERFPQLIKAFLESDEKIADIILKEYAPIKNECNTLLYDLFSESLPTREAVATALLSRYLKRINSHISNIASGLVYPMDRIDFVRGGILE